MTTNRAVVDAVLRASRRSANSVHLEMKRGIHGLATIAATAPLIGLYGAVNGVRFAVPSCGCSEESLMVLSFSNFASALMLAALGLLVAVPTLWGYRYLCSQIEAFDLEMENASAELANYVSRELSRQC